MIRLKTGAYPDQIEEAPSIIYRLKDDGTPLVYVIGVDEIDNGGIPEEDSEKGDWVWQYTYPEFDLVSYTEYPERYEPSR